jgi:hypothetical protein
MTLQEAKKMVEDAGFRIGGGCYEDENFIRAYSSQVIPGTYGYPRYVVEFFKPLAILTVTGPSAVRQ